MLTLLQPQQHHSYRAGGGTSPRSPFVCCSRDVCGVASSSSRFLFWLHPSDCVCMCGCVCATKHVHVCCYCTFKALMLSVMTRWADKKNSTQNTERLHADRHTFLTYQIHKPDNPGYWPVCVCVCFHVHVTLMSVWVVLCWYCNPVTLWFLVMLRPDCVCVFGLKPGRLQGDSQSTYVWETERLL